MPVFVACPSCGARMTAPDAFVGKKVKCPKCGDPVVVADPAADAGFEVVDDDRPAKPKPKSRPQLVAEDDGRPRKRKPTRADDDDYDEEEDDDDRPRRKKKAAKKKSMLPLLIVGAVAALVLVGGGITGLLLWSKEKAPSGPAAGPGQPLPAQPRVPIDATWARLDAPDGSFVAYFPGGPPRSGDLAEMLRQEGGDAAAAAPDIEKALAASGVQLQTWIGSHGNRTYMLQVLSFPPAAAQQLTGPNAIDSVYSSVKSKAMAGGNKVFAEANSTVGGQPAKQMLAQHATTGKTSLTRITVFGGKLYTLAVIGADAINADDATARQYFERFEFK